MTCKGFVFGGSRSFGSNSMLKLPVYLRGHTCYFHTRISGVQFKRSLGTSDPLTVGFRRSLTRDWRLMRLHGLGIKPRRRFVRTTDSDHDSPIFPNLYRNVIPSRPDLVGGGLCIHPPRDRVLLSGGHPRCVQPQGRGAVAKQTFKAKASFDELSTEISVLSNELQALTAKPEPVKLARLAIKLKDASARLERVRAGIT